jgi:hypothetical protein
MAAPHVSGVAALALSHDPGLRGDTLTLRGRILSTGRALASAGETTSTGRLVNARRAIDHAAPLVQAPDRYGVGVGTVVGSRTVTAVVRWPAARDALTGVTGYAVRRTSPAGTSTVPGATLARSVRSTLRFGTAYRFGVEAVDGAGNRSRRVDGPSVVATLHGDASSLARYARGWRTTSSGGATGRAMHTAYAGGSSMTFTFTGRAVALVAPKGPTRGAARIYVDGVLAATVDLHRPSTIERLVVFSRSWSTKARHEVRVVVVGTKGHSRVDIDGFVVIR